jgi:hypothetical protein
MGAMTTHLKNGGRTGCGHVAHSQTVTDDIALVDCQRCKETLLFKRAVRASEGPPVTDMKRLHEATHVMVRPDSRNLRDFAFDGRPMPIALDVGSYVWVHGSYADNLPEGALQIGDGRSPAYDQHGNRIISVPAKWCQFLTDKEAEHIERAMQVDDRFFVVGGR